MQVKVHKTAKELDIAAARLFVEQVERHPSSVCGLSTGATTGAVHREIVHMYNEHPFDTSRLTLFGVDEVTGVPREFAGACYTMLKNEIVDHLAVGDSRFLMLPVASDDFERDCAAFVSQLEALGGIDLLFLGLGTNAHLGFNQPGAHFGDSAHLSYMMPELEERLRRESGVGADAKLGGATMGIKDIMHARRIVVMAKGSSKTEAVRNMLRGPVTEQVPASVLQLHPDCTLLVDEEVMDDMLP